MKQKTWPRSSGGLHFTALPFIKRSFDSSTFSKPAKISLLFFNMDSSACALSRADFAALPHDVLSRIAASFTLPNLRAASLVCKTWRDALKPLREAMVCLKLGKRFKHGRGGVKPSLSKALDSFLKGAARGSTLAMVDAGLIYREMGRRDEGIAWYRKTAELGDPAGQCNLAISYLRAFARATMCAWKHKPAILLNFSHTLRGIHYAASANIYSCNRTINHLMKSGSLDSALKAFDEMTERDVVTWNIMVSGYYRHRSLFESLSFYSQMVSQGIVENSSTFSTVLSMCSSAGFFREGLVSHCRAVVLGLSTNVYVGSALVDLYLQMGLVDIALRLFRTLQERNLVSWNVVLRAFCEMGRSEEMMRMYNDMKLDGLEPNGLTFCYLIQGCGCERLLDGGIQLHCCVIKKGLANSNVFIANALVDFYSVCGSVVDTRKSFEVIPPEDVISWNSMVAVCASNGCSFDAIEIFQRMHFWGKKPSMSLFLGFLKLSTAINNVSFGRQIHSFILKLGLNSLHVQSALIDMYGKCGDIESSVNVFDTAPERTIECCNPLMTSLLRYGLVNDVIELFGLIVDENIGYDEVSLSLTLKAVSVTLPASSAASSLLHSCAIKSGFESDTAVTCSLIDAYSRSGEIRYSLHLFDQLSSPNVICFTSIISALARNGMGRDCLIMLDTMIRNGLKPDKVTFLSVLMGCNHSGLVEEGRLLFYSMQTDHDLCPERQHYSCMVDLLGRAGLLDEAEKFLKDSPWQVDYTIWSSLLRSCRIYRNEKVGKRAAQMLMDLEPENPSGWLQASNFYSDIGDYETMREFQEIAMARKMTKEIGCSLIEVHDHN